MLGTSGCLLHCVETTLRSPFPSILGIVFPVFFFYVYTSVSCMFFSFSLNFLFLYLVDCTLILKGDAVKMLHSICQHIWKIQQWPQNQKRSVFVSIPKKGNAKECTNHHTNVFLSHMSKVMLKILQARLQQYINCELPDVQAGFRNAEEPNIKLPTSAESSKKQESSRKTSISALLTTPKPSTVWITINCGKF